MTLGDLMVLTRESIRIRPQRVTFYPEPGIIVTCFSEMYERWAPFADRKVTGLKAIAVNEIVAFIEHPKIEEDPQIPGQMDITDYGIKGG